jgi:hypothetical protein
MQKYLLGVAALALSLSTGCLIRTHGHARGGSYSEARSCPPAHHWEGGECVHNGRGHGNGNGKGNGPVVRDHR